MTARRQRGFTLIEVMVAMGIMAVIAMMTWASLSNTIAAREILAEKDGVQRGARFIMSRLRRELELAWLTPTTSAQNTFRTVFVAEDNEPIDTLWFAALSHQRLYRGSRECDQTEITYWGEDNPNGDNYVLLHREAQRIDHEPDQDGVILPLAFDVRRLDMRFLDGRNNEWMEEWDSQSVDYANRLPRAVRMALVLMGPDPDDEENQIEYSFATTILLQFAEPISQSVFATGNGGGQGLNL